MTRTIICYAVIISLMVTGGTSGALWPYLQLALNLNVKDNLINVIHACHFKSYISQLLKSTVSVYSIQ